MRRFSSLLMAATLAIIVLAACNSKDSGTGANSGSFGAGKPGTNQLTPNGTASATPETMSDGVRRVTIVELRDMLDKGTAIVIDTRGADSYKANHIKGSISIPVDQVANRIIGLPRDKMIVAYCS